MLIHWTVLAFYSASCPKFIFFRFFDGQTHDLGFVSPSFFSLFFDFPIEKSTLRVKPSTPRKTGTETQYNGSPIFSFLLPGPFVKEKTDEKKEKKRRRKDCFLVGTAHKNKRRQKNWEGDEGTNWSGELKKSTAKNWWKQTSRWSVRHKLTRSRVIFHIYSKSSWSL